MNNAIVMDPEICPHNGAIVDGKNCYCEAWGRWTNCIDVGHCTKKSIEEREDDE